MRISVDVINPELDALEDKLMCWNLCDKHKSLPSEEEMYKASITCKKCRDIDRKLHNKALHLWSKLVTAYLKARDEKKKNI